MQITLVQADIETAIRNYIHDRVYVDIGMEPVVELAYVTGSEAGFKATIDFTPIVEVLKIQIPIQETQPSVEATTGGVFALPAKPFPPFATKTSIEKPTIEDTPEAEVETQVEVTHHSVAAPEPACEEVSEPRACDLPPTVPPPAVIEARKTQSLFKNLRKPVNA